MSVFHRLLPAGDRAETLGRAARPSLLVKKRSATHAATPSGRFVVHPAWASVHRRSARRQKGEENVRVAKELNASGLGTNNQVLDAETLRIVALTNRDDAAFDLLIAQFRLQRAMGGL
jgi:hypothetical protein